MEIERQRKLATKRSSGERNTAIVQPARIAAAVVQAFHSKDRESRGTDKSRNSADDTSEAASFEVALRRSAKQAAKKARIDARAPRRAGDEVCEA